MLGRGGQQKGKDQTAEEGIVVYRRVAQNDSGHILDVFGLQLVKVESEHLYYIFC